MKLLTVFILNIPLCIVLNIAILFIALAKPGYDSYLNPASILLILTAVGIQAFIIYRTLKYYDLNNRKSMIIGLSGVLITWVLRFVLNISIF
jgi:hypothetical protein